MDFRWNSWNIEHIGRHGVDPGEAEEVVRRSRPLYRGDGKYLSQGRGGGGRWLQVIYVLDDDGTVFVIHARPMSEREKRHFRRRWR
jgi:uncharacterized DUF497 family protein